ncbi:unnamed protein product [Gongylonema pulchrum]|uniref:Peptidase S1 domain-containing protein n=1 Tax=Gongylonema pulchrum TaxID=637853 RepID=A0A183D4A1_9BILA|nr:unnamed protein product [Gongylonema pulchrum]VDN26641.1 unnamed protein product [Gongylonema pulchrum]
MFRAKCFQGDSGGGLMTQLDDGRWVLLGVASIATGCTELLKKESVAKGQVHTSVAFYGADIAHFTGFFLPLVHV